MTDIVEKVRKGCFPYFRPFLDPITLGEDMCSLIQKCWMEDPVERPTFTYAKKTIERLNRYCSKTVYCLHSFAQVFFNLFIFLFD